MTPLKFRLLKYTLLLSMALSSAVNAAEPVMRLTIRRIPSVPVATNTAIAVPATQPAARLPVVSARMTFLPSVPAEADFEMNDKNFAIAALIEEKSSGGYSVKINLNMTERDQISDDPKNLASASAFEKIETSAYLRAGEERIIAQSSLSQWTVKIEKKNDQK